MSNTLNITKMQGIGNDYVYVDTFEQDEPTAGWPEVARRLSDRRFGVGGDGMILIQKPLGQNTQGRMRMFNNDGSEAEMCGNGLRCVAKYLHDVYYRGEEKLGIDTAVGPLSVEICERDDSGDVCKVKVNMAAPILKAADIPCSANAGGEEASLSAAGREFQYTAVSMGNPHCIIFVDDVENFAVENFGSAIENDTSLFPNRINVEFVQVVSRNEAIQRTWERGSGETHACGTGASAVAVAGILRGHFDSTVNIHLLGGDLQLEWAGTEQPVFMTGAAAKVFDACIDLRKIGL